MRRTGHHQANLVAVGTTIGQLGLLPIEKVVPRQVIGLGQGVRAGGKQAGESKRGHKDQRLATGSRHGWAPRVLTATTRDARISSLAQTSERREALQQGLAGGGLLR